MKPIDKKLREVANFLPFDMYNSLEQYTPTGEDLKLGGYLKGKSQEDKKMAIELAESGKFKAKRYVQIQKNHVRRLRRAYQRNGVKGVLKYVDPYLTPEHRMETVAKIQMYLL